MQGQFNFDSEPVPASKAVVMPRATGAAPRCPSCRSYFNPFNWIAWRRINGACSAKCSAHISGWDHPIGLSESEADAYRAMRSANLLPSLDLHDVFNDYLVVKPGKEVSEELALAIVGATSSMSRIADKYAALGIAQELGKAHGSTLWMSLPSIAGEFVSEVFMRLESQPIFGSWMVEAVEQGESSENLDTAKDSEQEIGL